MAKRHHGEPGGLMNNAFGLLAAKDDGAVFATLFAAAESWARRATVPGLRGPLGLR